MSLVLQVLAFRLLPRLMSYRVSWVEVDHIIISDEVVVDWVGRCGDKSKMFIICIGFSKASSRINCADFSKLRQASLGAASTRKFMAHPNGCRSRALTWGENNTLVV